MTEQNKKQETDAQAAADQAAEEANTKSTEAQVEEKRTGLRMPRNLSKKQKKELHFNWREMAPWQKFRLFGSAITLIIVFAIYLVFTCSYLYNDKMSEDQYWDKYANESADMTQVLDQYGQDATKVSVASYLENVRSIDLKNSQFEVRLEIGYRWEGDPTIDFSKDDTIFFYKGKIGDVQLLENYHQDGTNYQLVRYDVTINKTFWTPRFPLESHQLRVYMEPAQNITRLILTPDPDQSGVNNSLSITGFDMTRSIVNQTVISYENTLNNPVYDSFDHDIYKTEIMTAFEVNRVDFGLYFKCFIALYGTTAWIILCLYICTFRRVDPLGMIGAAFFGAVSNVMVGANLVPDALAMGLLEFTNLFGVAMIIAGTAIVISINTIRKEHENAAFARFYGRIMLVVFVTVVLAGNIALPLSAWLF